MRIKIECRRTTKRKNRWQPVQILYIYLISDFTTEQSNIHAMHLFNIVAHVKQTGLLTDQRAQLIIYNIWHVTYIFAVNTIAPKPGRYLYRARALPNSGVTPCPIPFHFPDASDKGGAGQKNLNSINFNPNHSLSSLLGSVVSSLYKVLAAALCKPVWEKVAVSKTKSFFKKSKKQTL